MLSVIQNGFTKEAIETISAGLTPINIPLSKEGFEKKLINHFLEQPDIELAKPQEMETSRGKYHGLAVKAAGLMGAPVLDVDELYNKYLADKDLPAILETAEDIFRTGLKEFEEKIKDSFSQKDFSGDALSERILPGLLPDQRTEGMIAQGLPGDISLTLGFSVGEDGYAYLRKENLAGFGVTEEEVWEAAFANAGKVAPETVVRPLIPFLAELQGVEVPPEFADDPMRVVGGDRVRGAACLFYPGVQQYIRDQYGSDYWCIPSSVHEWLTLPDDGLMDPDILKAMVLEVNATEVRECDRLSDTVYHYSEKFGFETAEQFLSH